MNQELKRIKKLYGEAMSRFCRDNFSTILEESGKLLEILTTKFEPNHFLYQDILNAKMESNFKNYIYSIYNVNKKDNKDTIEKTPEELLSDIGYNLYECKTEEEIQSFKKYYDSGEELCTFNGGRLNSCRVFFAVKKNVDEIKREDFKNPQRQDEYGTSVISIQFTKNGTNTLSIKNRYNHTVNNPDATFGNNLENIIKGLTLSFEQHYGIVQKNGNQEIDIPMYVRANDGKYYKYNYEINNKYYCPNNVIISWFNANKYESEKYIIMDYFILDLTNKRLRIYDWEQLYDSFVDGITNIEKIYVKNNKDQKEITIISPGKEEIIITLDNHNRIIGYKNNNITFISDNFLKFARYLKNLELKNVKQIEDNFLFNAKITDLKLDSLKKIGNNFCYNNFYLKNLDLPNIEEIGDHFCFYNRDLKVLDFPKLKEVSDNFLRLNLELEKLNFPSIKKIGKRFCGDNQTLESINFPNVIQIRGYFLQHNKILSSLFMPKLKYVGEEFLSMNEGLTDLSLESLKEVADSFIFRNTKIQNIYLPKLESVGNSFLMSCNSVKKVELPSLKYVKDYFFALNESIEYSDFPELIISGESFLFSNFCLKQCNIPNEAIIGKDFLVKHPNREDILNCRKK